MDAPTGFARASKKRERDVDGETGAAKRAAGAESRALVPAGREAPSLRAEAAEGDAPGENAEVALKAVLRHACAVLELTDEGELLETIGAVCAALTDLGAPVSSSSVRNFLTSPHGSSKRDEFAAALRRRGLGPSTNLIIKQLRELLLPVLAEAATGAGVPDAVILLRVACREIGRGAEFEPWQVTTKPIKLLNRNYTLGATLRYVEQCILRAGSDMIQRNKNDHSVAGVTGFSGRGKTAIALTIYDFMRAIRATVEAMELVRRARTLDVAQLLRVVDEELLDSDFTLGYGAGLSDAAANDGHLRDTTQFMATYVVYATFNGGTPWISEGEPNAPDLLHAIATRCLHSHFAWGMPFREFVCALEAHGSCVFGDKQPRALSLGRALDAIALDCGATLDAPVTVMLLIDEFQRLLPARLVPMLYNELVAMLTTGSRLYALCPIIFGLIMEPLALSARASNTRLAAFPLRLLTRQQSEYLVDHSSLGVAWRGKGRFQRAVFRARGVPKLLLEVVRVISENQGVSDDTLHDAMLRAGGISMGTGDPAWHALLRIFSCAMLHRTSLCDPADLTLWDSIGGIACEQPRADAYIDVPHSTLVSLSHTFRDTDGIAEGFSPAEVHLLECIKHLCTHMDSCVWQTCVPTWKALEEFSAMYLCMRVNAFLIGHSALEHTRWYARVVWGSSNLARAGCATVHDGGHLGSGSRVCYAVCKGCESTRNAYRVVSRERTQARALRGRRDGWSACARKSCPVRLDPGAGESWRPIFAPW